jgi:hypothetical protein
MTARPPKAELGLDMPFSEAMERLIGVDPKQMHANIARATAKKPPSGNKAKRKPLGKKAKPGNVISLKDDKTSRRRRGLA